MPWPEQAANSNELQRCMRDLVSPSALPAAWQNYDMYRIGESLVAALNWMVDADFVFALLGHGAPLSRLASINPGLDSASLDHLLAMLQLQLQRKTATPDERRRLIIPDPSTGCDLHVVTTLTGFGEDAILAAGSVRDTFPSGTEKRLLDAGVNQASIAFRQWLGDVDKRRRRDHRGYRRRHRTRNSRRCRRPIVSAIRFQQTRRHRPGFVDLPFNIEAHDGHLTVAPNPVGETIFSFTLPSVGVADSDSTNRLCFG